MGKAVRIIQYLRIAAGTGLAFVLFGLGGLFLNLVTLLIGVIPNSFPEKREQIIQKMVHYFFRAFYWYLKVFRFINGKCKVLERLSSTAYSFVAIHPILLASVLIFLFLLCVF